MSNEGPKVLLNNGISNLAKLAHFLLIQEVDFQTLKQVMNTRKYPGHQRVKVTLQMTTRILPIAFNSRGVYFELALPIPFGKQL